jgi:hypothetical protein
LGLDATLTFEPILASTLSSPLTEDDFSVLEEDDFSVLEEDDFSVLEGDDFSVLSDIII